MPLVERMMVMVYTLAVFCIDVLVACVFNLRLLNGLLEFVCQLNELPRELGILEHFEQELLVIFLVNDHVMPPSLVRSKSWSRRY